MTGQNVTKQSYPILRRIFVIVMTPILLLSGLFEAFTHGPRWAIEVTKDRFAMLGAIGRGEYDND